MRPIDNDLIKTLVTNFSHGAISDYDPTLAEGCQRESFHSLGFGWIYLGLSLSLQPYKALIIGSGRGFSAACFAIGIESVPDTKVTLVDPSYTSWRIDGAVTDCAAGFWKTEQQAKDHFQQHLGLKNIDFICSTSNEAFNIFKEQKKVFDFVMIDGDHSASQIITDIKNGFTCLSPEGIIFVHDSHCPHLPGVAVALESISATDPEIEIINLTQYPGLSILKKRIPLLTIKKATISENDILNTWRTAENITPRPLTDHSDPRPEEVNDDPREGLFAVFDNDEMIGGFGLKKCCFTASGADNFPPDPGKPTNGYLRYGSVIRHDRRGAGRWRLVNLEVLRWFGNDGFFMTTSHAVKECTFPYIVEEVGHTPLHTAFWFHPCNTSMLSDNTEPSMTECIIQLKNDKKQLEKQLDLTTNKLECIANSLIWRSSKPIRFLFDMLRKK